MGWNGCSERAQTNSSFLVKVVEIAWKVFAFFGNSGWQTCVSKSEVQTPLECHEHKEISGAYRWADFEDESLKKQLWPLSY